MTEQSQHALDRNDEHVAEATEGVAPMVAGVPVRLASLIARAEALADSGQRRILGSPVHRDPGKEPLPGRC